MPTPEEIKAKHDEFQAAVASLTDANTAYEAARTPYLAAKQGLVDAITNVGRIDDELEAMTKEYEPPAAPE